MVTVVHNKVDTLPDKQDELAQGKVCPSHWNEAHVITGLVAADSTYTPSNGLISTNVQDAIDELAATTGTLTFMFANAASDIGGFIQAVSYTEYTAAAEGNSSASVSTTPTLLGKFVTNAGYPNITELASGLITVHYDTTKASGGQSYYSYAEIYKRSSGGTETLLCTTDQSSTTSSNTQQSQTVTCSMANTTAMLISDRLVVKVYAVMITGTATVSVDYDGSTSARVELPVATVDLASAIYDSFVTSAGNYQTLANSLASHAAGVAVGTYPLAFQRSANLTTSGTEIIPIYAADYSSFGGLTPKLRIRAQVFTNATAPTASFQFGLYPISALAGAASNITYTMGTVVTGSTTGTVTTPASGSSTAVSSSDFTLPSDGLYCLGVIQSSNTTAANSLTALSAQLQIHYV